MNELIASILIALGIAKHRQTKPVEDETKTERRFTLPKGFEDIESSLVSRQNELRARERNDNVRFTIRLVLILGAMIGVMGAIIWLTALSPNAPQSEEQKMNAKIDAMTCIEQKNYYELHRTEEDSANQPPYAYRAWAEYNGSTWFNVHNGSCHTDYGYLQGDESRRHCTRDVGIFDQCPYWFPRDSSGIIHFPKDWFYSDSQTGNKITDPNQYLQIIGIDAKGVIDK